MEKEQDKTSGKPTEPWKFYREVTPSEEAMIEQHLKEHPRLTKEEVLEEIEAAGF
jgi:hypothetical protein